MSAELEGSKNMTVALNCSLNPSMSLFFVAKSAVSER